jgi:hypothetical protein
VPSFSRTLMCGGVAVAMLLGSQAWGHDEPRRAKTIKAPLVTAYKACTSPNTMTAGPIPVPACSPPAREDDICGFQGPFFKSGYGKASGITTPIGDFKLSFTAKGLNPGCEGRKLCAVASVRITTERCLAGSCTFDLPTWLSDTITGCCIVESGTCRVNTSINSEMLGVLEQGEKTGIQILGCGLKRMDGPSLPTGLTFGCGVLAP